ncbi:MAG TPA: hypothetical protein PKE26_15425 [Kiritimatiellia bacterium]|nr:hypothetical protein [Kiritimatiellia bacterium]
MRRFAPIIVPVLIWTASIIPAIVPGIFDLSRMADIVALGALGWLFLPMHMILVVFFQANLAVQLIALLLLLLPIGPLLIRPILNRHGFGWLTAIYSLFLFLYLSLGFYLASERINSIGIRNIYGYRYPEFRYDSYLPFVKMSENAISAELLFIEGSGGYMGEYEIHARNGGFIVVNDSEQNMDWVLRKMRHIPEEGYQPTIHWQALRSRRQSGVFFYFKFGDKYGKGVINGWNTAHAHVFIPEDETKGFVSANADPTFANWLKWFISKEIQVYTN